MVSLFHRKEKYLASFKELTGTFWVHPKRTLTFGVF